MEKSEESDQQPETGPEEQVAEDESTGDERDDANQDPGVPGGGGQATGNPGSAG